MLILRVVFLCLIVTSCASKSYWKYNQIGSGSSSVSGSSRVSYTASGPTKTIQLEIFQTKESDKGFLTVKTQPIPACADNPKQALFSLKIEEETFSYRAIRHEGGHRLLLPSEALQTITAALLNGKNVSIQIAGYRTTLESEGFSKQYKRLKPYP